MDSPREQDPPAGGPGGGSASRPGDYSSPGLGFEQERQAPGSPVMPPAGGPAAPGTAPPGADRPGGGAAATSPPPSQGGPPGQAPIPGAGYAPPPGPPAGSKRGKAGRGGGGARIWITAVAAGLISALVVLLALPAVFGVNPWDMVRGRLRNRPATVTTNREPVDRRPGASPTQGATDVSSIARQVTPSVVNIDIRTTPRVTPFSFGQSETGTGSGVIYRSDGYIITNNHVVSDAQEINVTLASGTELKGRKVGADPDTDIAVIKVEKDDLPAIKVGNSDNLVVGQLVVAVGSPFGFEQTVTAGIVSALHRIVASSDSSGQQTTVLSDLIQTDAPINPGNSGGALCDSAARLIGINAVIASQSGGSEGIGFAIPINNAGKVAEDLIAGKPVTHPYLGVLGQTISASIAERYNLPVSSGAYVTQVIPGSPADKAGVKQGDIIVALEGKPVKSMDEVVASVRSHSIGDKVSVTFYRGDSKKTADVTLDKKPAVMPVQ